MGNVTKEDMKAIPEGAEFEIVVKGKVDGNSGAWVDYDGYLFLGPNAGYLTPESVHSLAWEVPVEPVSAGDIFEYEDLLYSVTKYEDRLDLLHAAHPHSWARADG